MTIQKNVLDRAFLMITGIYQFKRKEAVYVET